MYTKETVIDIIKESGLVTAAQLREALIQGGERGVVESLIKLNYISETEVIKAVARHFGLAFVDLKEADIEPQALQQLSRDMARRYHALPVSLKGNVLTLAVSDPLNLDVIDSISFVTKKEIDVAIAGEADLKQALLKYYAIAEEGDQDIVRRVEEEPVKGDEGDYDSDEEAPVIKLVSMVIMEAFRMRASDIHLEPLEKRFRVRYRIDGVLYEVEGPPKRLQSSIISRVKIMANMSIAEKRLPQDGRIRLKIMNKDIDLRVSTLPGTHGESVVMRILDKSSLVMGLAELGFLDEDEKRFQGLISMPNGILLITGPTGSGKTTTLYGCLNELNRPNRKIITVEDPIEYQIPGINQVHVQEKIGLTFASVLRAMLRQAPNVIMIGEIRDLETANIAVNASLTGHLVFSTLHTNDAPGAITRLIDQGVKPFLVASSVRAVLAQRLVRKICTECKEEYVPRSDELRSLNLGERGTKRIQFFHGKGCQACNNTGFRGRIGIFELLVIDEELQKMIFQKTSSTEIRKRARQLGMRTLREDGVLKVFGGITTINEVLRVTEGDEE
ncbi:MAG TPA: type II secretion system ATPase GspE [bacterium]|nr:type II secretion system ATPase GspE [bacterium]